MIADRGPTYSQGDVVQHYVEPRSSPDQVVSYQPTDVLSLRNKLAGVELRDNTLEDLIDDRRQNALIVIRAEGAIDLGKGVDPRPRQHTASDVHHLQVLCAGERSYIAGFGANVICDWCFEPGDSNVRP